MGYRLYFLYFTLFTLPFSIRKVFWHGSGDFFPEYSDISIYLFEVFLICYILISILEHKNEIKSILRKVFHVEHLLLFGLLISSTAFFAISEQVYYPVALFLKWIVYIIFGCLLYKDLKQIVPRGTISTVNALKFNANCSTWNNLRLTVFYSLIFQSIVIILQFLSQKSLGLFFIGESILSTSINGVSTTIISGNEVLRGYGTLLHPNLAAFFIFSYILFYYFFYIVPRGTISGIIPNNIAENCSTWNIKPKLKLTNLLFHVEHNGYLLQLWKSVPRGTYYIALLLVIFSILLTFSKAVLGITLLLILAYIVIYCSTWNNKEGNSYILRMFHVEQSTINENKGCIVPRGTILSFILLILTSLILLSAIDRSTYIGQSILERKNQYLSIPIDTAREVVLGSGVGSYVYKLSLKSPGLYSWQYQPLHNSFLLILFEIGLLPLCAVTLYFLSKRNTWFARRTSITQNQYFITCVFVTLILLLFVDHYMWDLEQGQFLVVTLITTLMFSYTSEIPKKLK